MTMTPNWQARWFMLALGFLALNGYGVWRLGRAHGTGANAPLRVAQFRGPEKGIIDNRTPLQWSFSRDAVDAATARATKLNES